MSIVNFLYNPDRKGKDQLISEFIVRNKILDDIMHDLESSPMKTPEQHYLLIGQRGAGKSTLLNRIKYAVEDSARLKTVLIPILFGEEQYNVGELANLWENVARALEDYHGFNGLCGEMEKYVQREDFEEKCWDILESALNERKIKLLLLIDNIGDLFKKINEVEVRRWRELLQTKSQIRLIAASPFYLESLLDYKQPMFEFFKVIRLDELTSEETFQLLLKLGEIHGEKERIEKIIKESPGRVESLRTLSGGVPRTIALMFNIFIEHEHENSLNDLDRILDNVTPLYKHRMDDLPAQQQKIIDAVARNWDPISVKALKDRVRLESKVISAQLRQLEKNQVVQKMETGTKNHEYILKERFFNIWYLMRYGRKDDRQRVIWLVKFLESWCTDEEIEKRVKDFIEQIQQKGIDHGKLEFLAETYTLLGNLRTESKILLRDRLPEYRRNLKFSDKEIDEIFDKKLKEKDFESAISILINRTSLTNENKMSIIDASGDNKNGHEIRVLVQERIERNLDQRKPIGILGQILVNALWPNAVLGIRGCLSKGAVEEALNLTKDLLTIVAVLSAVMEDIDYISESSMELMMLTIVINQLYSAGQYHSLIKILEDGISEDLRLNVRPKFTEVFNPIYLALISLDPEGKKVNIVPEKEAIVRQIKNIIATK